MRNSILSQVDDKAGNAVSGWEKSQSRRKSCGWQKIDKLLAEQGSDQQESLTGLRRNLRSYRPW